MSNFLSLNFTPLSRVLKCKDLLVPTPLAISSWLTLWFVYTVMRDILKRQICSLILTEELTTALWLPFLCCWFLHFKLDPLSWASIYSFPSSCCALTSDYAVITSCSTCLERSSSPCFPVKLTCFCKSRYYCPEKKFFLTEITLKPTHIKSIHRTLNW